MRQLLNTLFVTSEDIYLSLDGENVVANRDGETVARYPLHTLQSIVTFSYAGASPALMGKCAQREIGLVFCSQRGKFLARVSGQMQGNVLLRRMQYRVADDPSQSCRIARNMIFGKVYNARWSVERTRRDHAPRVDGQRFSAVSQQLQGLLPQIAAETSPDSLRGLEGIGAAAYFSVLDEMILQGKETFFFRERSRRPPLDAFNAMLSFAYSLLSHDCASALESVGLDAYVGYLHTDRPGRESLALDLMQELRHQTGGEVTDQIKELQEELLAHYQKGTFLISVQEDGQIPVLKQKDGSMYQPIFTDMIEFTRFAQGKKMKTAAIPADKIPEILIPDAKGVAINPFGVNVRLDITKANKQKPEA